MHDDRNSIFEWLGFELHDGLLQWIVATNMQLESSIAYCDAHAGNEELREQLIAARRYTKLAMEEGRGLIGFLDSQPTSGLTDLSPTIESFVDRVRSLATLQTQELTFRDTTLPWPLLPAKIAWNVLRIVQQAVNNAIQHAGPGTIAVTLDRTVGRLTINVRDDGVGYDLQSNVLPGTVDGHFGMANMRQRARSIDAELTIQAAPGKGCRIELQIDEPPTE